MTTLAEIKEKLATIRRDLDEVAAAVEELDATQARQEEPPRRGLPPGISPEEREALSQTFAEIMRRAGIEHVQPIGAEALQEMMRQQGVRPEDCIGSRGIIEMREE